ncbi:hypothetical protein U9M48_023756 [Paspalum notatum var. saurae]|uniref:Secreted protein n=1 Tax=Paspalum notatum var. saurae TaxID=547442 RepID=A0AAQ3TMA2_PASNO
MSAPHRWSSLALSSSLSLAFSPPSGNPLILLVFSSCPVRAAANTSSGQQTFPLCSFKIKGQQPRYNDSLVRCHYLSL